MGKKMWRHHNVADNVHDMIRLTDFEHRIMNGPLFNRLHYVYQDSTVFFTWPAVRIQRFEHSLGCMHLAGQMFYNAIANADKDVLDDFAKSMYDSLGNLVMSESELHKMVRKPDGSTFSKKNLEEVKNFVGESYGKKAECENLEPLCFLIPSRVPPEIRRIVMCLAEGVRLAGMLHDLGHPPFSHVCEQALSDLYEECESERFGNSQGAKGFVACMSPYLGGGNVESVALHEAIGRKLSSLAISQALGAEGESKEESLFSLVSGVVALAILQEKGDFGQLHAIVCGVVDADRLDFVQRDSKASGVGADAMQYGRLIEGLRLMRAEENSYVFALPAKALPTVEDFLRKRLSNYKTIVFHHSVVKSEELLVSVLRQLAARYFENDEKASSKSNSQGSASDLYVLPNDVSGLWSPLADGLDNLSDAVLTFSQWNDSWLLTMLRGEYTRLKVDSPNEEGDELLRRQLAELLYAEKSYRTVVKRAGDCQVFRKTLRSLISEHRDEMVGYLEECEKDLTERGSVDADEGAVSAHGIVRVLRSVVCSDEATNILRTIDENYSAFKMADSSADPSGAKTFSALFKAMVEASLKKVDCSFSDVLLTRNRIKVGIGGNSAQTYFYSDEGDIYGLHEQSAVGSVLGREAADLPAFFVYVLCDEKDGGKCRSKEFFEGLAKLVYEFVYDCVINSVNFIQ